MNAVAALLTASLGTYALRLVSVRALAHRELPRAIGTSLRHAALAIMAALVVSSSPSMGSGRLPTVAATLGLTAAGVAARRTGRLAMAIAIGLLAYAVAGAVQAGS